MTSLGKTRRQACGIADLVLSDPILADVQLSSNLRRALYEAHQSNWFKCHPCEDMFTARTGTRPG
eukprot:523664-Alexandrium_andersonii.AAC.1